MKKLFTFLFSFVLASVLTQGFAQNNIYMWNNGVVKAISSSTVDSLTFSVSDSLFKVTTSAAANITAKSFDVAGTVSLNEKVGGLANTPVIGVCYSSENVEPTVEDDTLALTAGYGNKSVNLSGLTRGTTYYYRLYVRLLDATFYGNVCSAATLGEDAADNSREINGHRFVDLGLPSGLLWAETNIGASSAEEAGDYFAWGETATKTKYNSGTYTLYNVDHEGNLTADEDAATANWGEGVRMPTQTEMEELYTNCTLTWTKVNGKAGLTISSKNNGNEIFLPAAGFNMISNAENFGSDGWYWTSTPVTGSKDRGYAFSFASNYKEVCSTIAYYGRSIRAVAEVRATVEITE